MLFKAACKRLQAAFLWEMAVIASLIVPQSKLIGTAVKGFHCQMGRAQGLALGMVTVA